MRPKPDIHTLPVEEIDVPVPVDTDVAAISIERAPSRSVDLGPNGQQVLDLLERAAMLSPDERKRLAEVASWRWWPLTLPVGGASAAPRAMALLRARGAGRADAVPWIEARATDVSGVPGRSSDRLAVRAVANAALAMLARDVVTDEVFDALYGPWREVTHR